MILRDMTITGLLTTVIDLDRSDKAVDLNSLISQVNPNSLDLTIADTFKRPLRHPAPVTYGFEGPHDRERYDFEYWVDEKDENYITLEPDQSVLACTREYITMPENLCGQLFTKSSLGRMFINHMMAGVIDAGFHGRLTLELRNDGPHKVRIPVGSRVVQIYLMRLDGITAHLYGERQSKYMDAETVECAK